MSEPGCGKTAVAIALAQPRIASSGKSILVLGPKTALRSAWGNDLTKFAPELAWSIAYAENRQRAFDIPAHFYLTNHDAAKWLAKQPKKFFDKFCGLIIDESGAYKHHSAQRSKAIAKIRDRFAFCQLLNGTPNSNSILDVWHQAYILDQGQRLGRSFYAFRNSVCLPDASGMFLKWVDKPGAEIAVAGLLRDVTIRHKLTDCADLPPNHEYTVPYHMSEVQARAYEEMRVRGLAELSTGDVNAVNASAVATKLLQIASGAVYDGEYRYHVVDTGRYELIADLVEARKNTLVFFNWKHQKDLLIAEFERRGLTFCVIDGSVSQREREEHVDNFEAGFYRSALLHPASAAHALTLVRAKTAIWASPTVNAEYFLQGNRRMNRIGQTERTETIVVLAPGTADMRVYYDVLGPKRMKITTLLEEMVHEKT